MNAERLIFGIPNGMSHEGAADTFSAYLLGSLAHENPTVTEEFPPGKMPRKIHGPRKISDIKWQLDPSNDFWYHALPESTGWIECRHPKYDQKLVIAMVKLFSLRFKIRFHGYDELPQVA